jgi:hypothetical protein
MEDGGPSGLEGIETARDGILDRIGIVDQFAIASTRHRPDLPARRLTG